MRNDWWRRLAVGLSLFTVGSFGGRLARAHDDPKGVRDLVIPLAEPGEVHGEELMLSGRYRIGVKCAPAGETLHAQLPDLPNDQGLVVEQVIDKGPAANAGIKVHDILIAAGEKPLGQVADLTGAIENSKGSELTIKLLRGGKATAVVVKPEEQKQLGISLRAPLGADQATVESWVKKLEIAPQSGLEVLQPRLAGGVLDLGQKHELPADLSVDIHREGKKPAKITVKKGDQQWVVSEDDLTKLPEEIRREVEPLLGGPVRFELKDLTTPFPIAGPPLGDVLVRPAESVNRLEKRLDEMSKRLDEMRSTIDQLRDQRRSLDSGAEKKSYSPRQ
jgi:membrane-associated protease RseP (regulator of RpoE activity)